MLDEIERLRANQSLLQLLSHYAGLAQPDREIWHDRLAAMDGVGPPELTKLHGELLAFGWIEWTSGQIAPKLSRNACYRVTGDGLRAHRMVGDQISSGERSPVAIDVSTSTVVRRKREKKSAAERASVAD